VIKTIEVTTAGTLTYELTNIEKRTITNLIVTGNLDARDIKCMRDEIIHLAVLDISATTIQAYSGSDGTVSNTSVDYPSNEIPQNSFNYNNTIKSIIFPNTLTSIAKMSFYACSGLSELNIPNNVIALKEGSFGYCTSITKVALGSSISSIEKEVFKNCTNLATINLPNSLNSIGDTQFCNYPSR